MNDGIQPIRYVPQINKLDPKGRVGDKKSGEKKKQDFEKSLSENIEDVENKTHDQVKEESKNTDHHKQECEDSMQDMVDYDLDDGCGTIINTEV